MRHSAYPNVSLVAVGMLQLQSEHSVRRIVCMQRLLRHNPHMSLASHIVFTSIAEYHLSVLSAAYIENKRTCLNVPGDMEVRATLTSL